MGATGHHAGACAVESAEVIQLSSADRKLLWHLDMKIDRPSSLRRPSATGPALRTKKQPVLADGFAAARAPKTVLTPAASGSPFTLGPISKPLQPGSLSLEDRGFLRIAIERLLGQAHQVGGELAQRFGGGSSMYHQGLFGDSSKDPALLHAVNQVINDGEYSNEKQFFQNDPAKLTEYLKRGGPVVQAVAEFAARAGLSGAFPELKQRTATPPLGTPAVTTPSTPAAPSPSAWQTYQSAARANPFSPQTAAARADFVKRFTGADVRALLGQTRNQAEEYAVYKALTQSGLGFSSNPNENDAISTWREAMRAKYGEAGVSRLINYYEQDSGTPHNNVTLDWSTGEFVSDPRWKWDEMDFNRHASEAFNPAFAGWEGNQADILQRRKIQASWLK